jgi:hypothetical protein
MAFFSLQVVFTEPNTTHSNVAFFVLFFYFFYFPILFSQEVDSPFFSNVTPSIVNNSLCRKSIVVSTGTSNWCLTAESKVGLLQITTNFLIFLKINNVANLDLSWGGNY